MERFARATGLDQAAKTADSVYTISVYRAAPGHREQLLKVLNEPLPGEVTAGNVVMQHLEGGPWNYLSISRYNSWLDFAKGESSSVAETRTGKGGWFELRAHAAYHNDTVADRIAP